MMRAAPARRRDAFGAAHVPHTTAMASGAPKPSRTLTAIGPVRDPQ
jgi:hypothetical protein